MSDFNNQTVLITGASGGLGSAVTDLFLSAGATVVGVVSTVRDTPQKTNYTQLAADLTSAASVDETLSKALQISGKIDVLVHTVGGFAGGTRLHETDDDAWERMMSLNVKTAFLVTRAVLRPMIEAGYGRIVAVGARPGTAPVAGLSAYAASKAALHSLIQTLAIEQKDHGITANVVMPSIIDTPANRKSMPKADFDKWVTPQSIARQILWLGSEDAADVSGALIPVYGRS